MLRFNQSLTFAAMSAVVLQACVIETVNYNPIGTAVDLQASWDVNGAPATQASCDAAGIDIVELVFLDGSIEYRYGDFVFDCAQGAVLLTGVLNRGTYDAFWESRDAAGNVLQQTDVIVVDANTIDDVARPDVPNFTTSVVVEGNDAVLNVSWDSNIATEIDAVDCATIEGVDFVAYALFDDEQNTLVKDYMWQTGCADQITIPEEDLVLGTEYRVEIDGGPEEGLSYWQSTCYFTATEGGTTTSCEAADVRYRMSVSLVWDSNEAGEFSAADCDGAGVEFMDYELRPEGGSAIAGDMRIDCGNTILFEEPLVSEGETYELTIIGHDDNTYGAEWTILCQDLTAGTGVAEMSCQVQRG